MVTTNTDGSVGAGGSPPGLSTQKQIYPSPPYDQRLHPDAALEALDPALLRRFVDRTPLQGSPVADALERYRLIVRDGKRWRVTNAALLLFGWREGFRWHPRADIHLLRVAGPGESRGFHWYAHVVSIVRPPLFTALGEVRRITHAQLDIPRRLSGRRLSDEQGIPAPAWEEALVNAVAHRDYEDQDRETKVWFYEDRMEIHSPGGVVRPVTEDALRAGRRTHAARNPILVDALVAAGYMLDRGEGLPRIRWEMEEASLPPPEISVEQGTFITRLFRRSPVSDASGSHGSNSALRPPHES